MAIHSNLPIYKAAYTLLDVVTEMTRNMRRDFKRSIGEKIASECTEITILVFRANVAHDKSPHLVALIERIEVINLMLRLAQDKRLISRPAYAAAVELTTSIGKQANGWRRAATRPLHGGYGRHD